MRVLVCEPIAEEGVKILEENGFKVDLKLEISKEELARIIEDYDALIVRGRTKVTRELMERAVNLKVIGRAGSGLDNIDVKAAEEMGITVINTPEAVADSVAELTIGLMLSLVRMIPYADRSMKEGKWLKRKLKGRLLKGKTLGLIGLGNVGLRVARIAKAMGMKILVTKRTPPPREILRELDAEFLTLPELLKRSDIVTLHVPLTDETYKMIGVEELRLMKPGALLINTSRGAILDHEALMDALESGRLGGAALDVYESEPPCDVRLMKLRNVVCTPHIGAQTEEARCIASILIAKKIVECLSRKSG